MTLRANRVSRRRAEADAMHGPENCAKKRRLTIFQTTDCEKT